MESLSILLEKEYLNFAIAHFLIFPDGSQERLHGHNYRVSAQIHGELSQFGLVVDFNEIKPILRGICDELDQHFVIPGEHKELTYIQREDDVMEVRYRQSFYAAPVGDCLVLPLNNISVENLSRWLAHELMRRIAEQLPEVQVKKLRLSTEESPGQRGVYDFCVD